MTTYYVNSQIGSNNNAGTSESAPLASLQAAAILVEPGDTVEVMNGTYTAPAYGVALDITTSGTASAPITFEAAPGQTPVIDSSGGWNAIDIQASYIVVEGFNVVGDAANYTLQSALAGYSTGNAGLDGNGIVVWPSSTVALPNHITIENNTVYDEPGGGIATNGADYIQILNNVVYNNGNWSAYGTSGITVNSSVNLDTNAGPHDIISGNLVYNNAQLVPSNGVGTITDGEGIILDTNPNYTAEILVEDNTVYGNGSAGIESFLTNNAVITENTVYGNDTQNVQPQSDAEIFINQSSNDTVTNNITVNPNIAAPVISSGAANSNDSVTLTGTAPDGATVTVSDGGASALGTATASNAGAWSFTSADLAAGAYAFTATDTTAAGTSAKSSALDVTVPLPAAPVISNGAVNANDSVTLTGTAPDGATVTVSDGGASALGTATASNAGAWSFTSADLAAGAYAFTATDTTAAGTSAKSSALDVTVTVPLPAAPVISNGAVNANELGDADRNGAGRGDGDGFGWRRERAGNCDREQRRGVELHQRGPGGRRLCVHRHRHDGGGDKRKVERARRDGAAAGGAGDQQRRGQCQRLGDADRNGAGRGDGDGFGWRRERAGNCDREQRRGVELHQRGPGGRRLCVHRHRHDGGGDKRKVERARRDGAAAGGAGDQQRRGQCQRLGDADRNGAGRGDGDGFGWRRERAGNCDREQRRGVELHQRGPGGRRLCVHRHRHDGGGNKRKVERARRDGDRAAAGGAGDQQRRGQCQRLGDADRNGAGRGDGDGFGWRRERAGNCDREQRRGVELHQRGPGGRRLCVHRHRHDGGGNKRKVERARRDGDRAAAGGAGDQQRRGQCQRLGDADRNGAGWGDGDGFGWRRERAGNCDREQRRGVELHQRGPGGRRLCVHRHRHDGGGDKRKVERARRDGAAAGGAGDQQRRGQCQRLGDADRNGAGRGDGDGFGWRRERAGNCDREQRRGVELHQRGPGGRRLCVHRHRHDGGGNKRKVERARRDGDRAAAGGAGDQQRRGQCQRLGDADRNGAGRGDGDGFGWRRERAGNCDREQRRGVELHQRGPGGRRLCVHRHRHDGGGNKRKVERARRDGDRAAAGGAGDQQRRGQCQRLGDADRNGAGWGDGDGFGWRRERAGNCDREQRRGVELHQRGPGGRRLCVHRHRHDGGGDERKVERARRDGAAAGGAGDQQRRGQCQRTR